MRPTVPASTALVLATLATGCTSRPLVAADGLPVRKVVVYRNGVGYFERAGHVEGDEVRFKMRPAELGDFLATLAVMERGGGSVRSAAFPTKVAGGDAAGSARPGGDLQTVVLSLDGRSHDLQVGYVAESPVWRPSYRLVVTGGGQAELQAWGIVQNQSGEDWRNVSLSLVAGAPLAFQADLAAPVIPPRPVVTDEGEVIASVPRGETSLEQQPPPAPPAPAAAPLMAPALQGAASLRGARKSAAPMSGAGLASDGDEFTSAKEEAVAVPSPPRNLRSLAAVAAEAGSTRYDLPQPVNVPDASATMVLLLSRAVPGESLFLFAPDEGVPDSASHPFRVARFTNTVGGVLERGPIAVFEQGAFLGQGMVDPLPAGATATVPFALERSVAIDRERKLDELGARVAKIENGELTIERDVTTRTIYRVKNGGFADVRLMVKHPRVPSSRLFNAPAGTEDNVGTGAALIPGSASGKSTADVTVEERVTVRRPADWFGALADGAVKAYLASPEADRTAVQRLTAAWTVRDDIVKKTDEKRKLEGEATAIASGTEETRRNLRAIEKNRTADALRQKLTARLAEASTRLDDLNRRVVELQSKLAELHVTFREATRDLQLVVTTPPPAS
jgi:hypothetical protein